MNPIKFILLLLLCGECSLMASTEIIKDYIISYKSFTGDSTIYIDDKLLLLELDLNNDGTKEMLLSMARNRNGKEGNIWHVFTKKNEHYKSLGVITFNQGQFYLGELPEGKYGLASFSPAGAGEGTLWGYTFDGTQIHQIKLGEVKLNRKSMELENNDLLEKYFGERAANGNKVEKVIDAYELAKKFGIKVSGDTYRQALEKSFPTGNPSKSNK